MSQNTTQKQNRIVTHALRHHLNQTKAKSKKAKVTKKQPEF